MKLSDCHSIEDFRKLSKKKLPSPIFDYIDGGSDDEITLDRNTDSFNKCDLVPNVLTGSGSEVDLSTTILGQKIDFPLFLAPTSMQRLFHPGGEKETAKAAEKMGTMFSMSTMATTSIEEISKVSSGPKLFQLYIHKDKGLTDSLIERCKKSNFSSMCLTVDTIVAGNRERDLRSGFTTPVRLKLNSLASFIMHPKWSLNYFLGKKFQLENIIHTTEVGSNIEKSVIDYINEQFDPSMSWKDAEYCVKKWGGPFALKGVMSVEDARKAVDIGCTAIMVSNHGGRQLDGSRAPFDQLAEIVEAVGDKVEVILDGGIRRGTHVLKALALGAKACSFGKGYLYALSVGGEKGVTSILKNMRNEINRNMILMGCKNFKELNKNKIRYR